MGGERRGGKRKKRHGDRHEGRGTTRDGDGLVDDTVMAHAGGRRRA